ncbi:MAG: sialidase family protein [Thermoanaerobaculia bacterium]
MIRPNPWRCLTAGIAVAIGLLPRGLASAGGPAPTALSPRAKVPKVDAKLCTQLDDGGFRGALDGLLVKLAVGCGRLDLLGGVTSEEARGGPLHGRKQGGDLQVNDPIFDLDSFSRTQSETSIAENPDAGILCSAFNDSAEYFGPAGGGGFTGFARSETGAATWEDRGALSPDSFGDPSLVWSRRDATFYIAALHSSGLGLWRSDKCGEFTFLSNPSVGGDDKEILAVDNEPGSPHFGSLYVVWTDFDAFPQTTIRAVRSSDGGASWGPEVVLATANFTQMVQGAWPAVSPNGDLFVAWLEYADFYNGPISIHGVVSHDGGSSFSAIASPLTNATSPQDAAASSACGRGALNGYIRYLPSPQIVVDRNKVLHVVYSYDPDGANVGDTVNVYYRRSIDGGVSWSTEVKLNDDNTSRDQYFPALTLSGSTLLATWYDRRLDPANLLQDYYKRTSDNGGVSWNASVRVSDVSTPIHLDGYLAGCYHGDYDQSILNRNNLEISQWADDRYGSPSEPDQNVYTDVGSNRYRCVVDLTTGTNNCQGPVSLTMASGRAVGSVNLEDAYVRLDAVIEVCNPTGFVNHFADSPTCDGGGGDAGTTQHDAEAYLQATDFLFWGMEAPTLPEGLDPAAFEKNAALPSGCHRVLWTIYENELFFAPDFDAVVGGVTRRFPGIRVSTLGGFELAPYDEPDTQDPAGADSQLWYVGLNRTVGSAALTGTGTRRACFVLSRNVKFEYTTLNELCLP